MKLKHVILDVNCEDFYKFRLDFYLLIIIFEHGWMLQFLGCRDAVALGICYEDLII